MSNDFSEEIFSKSLTLLRKPMTSDKSLKTRYTTKINQYQNK